MKGTLFIYVVSSVLSIMAFYLCISNLEIKGSLVLLTIPAAFSLSYCTIKILMSIVNKKYVEKQYELEKKMWRKILGTSNAHIDANSKVYRPNITVSKSSNISNKFILNGICACDNCGKDLLKGLGCLNNRNSRLYCEECWNYVKGIDSNGEEINILESFQDGATRTSRLWK